MVTPDVLDTERFDCSTCLLAERQEQLWPDNADAWAAYRQLSQRFTVERGLVEMVFRRLIAGRDWDEVEDLLDRLGIIHELIQPPQSSS